MDSITPPFAPRGKTGFAPRGKAGRPTREHAAQRHHELLDAALDHFLAKGFELATIDAIAAAVGMTKRTVYARYPDKATLFRAAVALAVERYSVPAERIAATECDDLTRTLSNIARLRVDQVMTPNGLRLQRIINTESYRFPDIFNVAYERGAKPTICFLADLLERATLDGRLTVADPLQAAHVFMSMVVSGPVRIIVSGNPLPMETVDERIAFAIRLFLDGARPR